MFQIAQPIWNDIEKLEDLKYNLTRVLFLMVGEEIDEKLELMAGGMEKQGVPNKVILSVQVVFPLLLEHSAIQSYLNRSGRYFELKDALPEILDEREAVALMRMEYMLDDEECLTLTNILSGLLEIANDDFEHIMVWFKHHAYDYVANSSKRIISDKEAYSAYKRLKKYFDKKLLT